MRQEDLPEFKGVILKIIDSVPKMKAKILSVTLAIIITGLFVNNIMADKSPIERNIEFSKIKIYRPKHASLKLCTLVQGFSFYKYPRS